MGSPGDVRIPFDLPDQGRTDQAQAVGWGPTYTDSTMLIVCQRFISFRRDLLRQFYVLSFYRPPRTVSAWRLSSEEWSLEATQREQLDKSLMRNTLPL